MASWHRPQGEVFSRRAPVTHDYAALMLYTGGGARMEQTGEWTLREGDAFLVPAGQPHRMLARERPAYWGLALSVPCIAAQGSASLLEPFERVRDGHAPIVRIPPRRQEYLAGLFRELEEVGRERRGSPTTLAAVERSLLTLILAEIERAGPSEALPSRGGGVVVEALRFIERNCLKRLTLDDVAAAVHRRPTYVTAALTKATGRSAGAWILAGRMAEARRLLLHSDEMIEIIGERVGYADATHFIRTFKREHGATPAAWRAARSTAPRPPEAPSTARR